MTVTGIVVFARSYQSLTSEFTNEVIAFHVFPPAKDIFPLYPVPSIVVAIVSNHPHTL